MTEFSDLKSIKIANTYFKENTNIVTVNCNNLDFVDNDAEEAFRDCSELTEVINLSNNLAKMKATFRACQKMITPPIIPSSVTNMTYTFYDCRGMTSVPDLSNCTALTTIERCFAYNYELLETPVIPESVTNMKNVCQGCKKITSFPNIPNGVTDLTYAFDQCTSVVKCNIEIPAQITNMNHTFYRCTSLKGKIIIHAENITDATDCFTDTTLSKKVYIPFQKDGNNTITYNSFISAGYDELGTMNGVTLLDLNTYIPPEIYDFNDEDGSLGLFEWVDNLTESKEVIIGDTTVYASGISCGSNMSVNGTKISHSSNNEISPGEESYVEFLFNVTSGMFKPKTLMFDICKLGTDGGSALVTIKYNNMDEEETVCTLPEIARNNVDPYYTHTEIDLSTFNLGASKGVVSIKFYLYNQSSTKSFNLNNVKLNGLLLLEDNIFQQTKAIFDFSDTETYQDQSSTSNYAILTPSTIINENQALDYTIRSEYSGTPPRIINNRFRIYSGCVTRIPCYGNQTILTLKLYNGSILINNVSYSASTLEESLVFNSTEYSTIDLEISGKNAAITKIEVEYV